MALQCSVFFNFGIENFNFGICQERNFEEVSENFEKNLKKAAKIFGILRYEKKNEIA